jgi:hypothetical protein
MGIGNRLAARHLDHASSLFAVIAARRGRQKVDLMLMHRNLVKPPVWGRRDQGEHMLHHVVVARTRPGPSRQAPLKTGSISSPADFSSAPPQDALDLLSAGSFGALGGADPSLDLCRTR